MSPELIVFPVLPSTKDLPETSLSTSRRDKITQAIKEVDQVLQRLHVLVIGPGLGRDDLVLETTKELIVSAKSLSIPLIIDGVCFLDCCCKLFIIVAKDGLYLVAQQPALIEGYTNAILTPNGIEYSRLTKSVLGIDTKDVESHSEVVQKLAAKLGNVTILRKGEIDLISDGIQSTQCKLRSKAC